MTPPKVVAKPKHVAPPVAIPRDMELPEGLEVGPKQTLFGILKEYRDQAAEKNPKSLLGSYAVDALVYAVQAYRESNEIRIKNGKRIDPIKEGNKFKEGILIDIQSHELLNLKEALTENALKKLHLMLKTDGWKPSEIWVNPEVRKEIENSKPKSQSKIAKPHPPAKPSLPHSPGEVNKAAPKVKNEATKNVPSAQGAMKGGAVKKDPYPWFKPTGALVKHVDINSLNRVEAWRNEVQAEIAILSHNKLLAAFIPPIDKVLGVIHRESKGRPWEKGDFDEETKAYKSYGLTQMQVATANRFYRGMNEATLLDGKTNIRVALKELTEYHKKAAQGDPSKINEYTLNVAIAAHNVGKGWFYRGGFSAERREMLNTKVAAYLREVDFVAAHLKFVGKDNSLLASAQGGGGRAAAAKP